MIAVLAGLVLVIVSAVAIVNVDRLRWFWETSARMSFGMTRRQNWRSEAKGLMIGVLFVLAGVGGALVMVGFYQLAR